MLRHASSAARAIPICIAVLIISLALGVMPAPVTATGITLASLARAKPGEPISLQLQNQFALSGVFLGTGGIDSAEPYEARYEKWRASRPPGADSASLPALGANLDLSTTTGRALHGVFAGCAGSYLLLIPDGSAIPRPVRLAHVRELREVSSGLRLAGEAATGDAWQGTPALGVVWIAGLEDTLAIPAGMIERVRSVGVPDNRGRTGLGVIVRILATVTLAVMLYAAKGWQ